MVMSVTSFDDLIACWVSHWKIKKAADPGVGFRGLEAAGGCLSQQLGGLQARFPGKSPLAARPIPPTRRMRAHVDTWTSVAEMAARATEGWPYAGMPDAGL